MKILVIEDEVALCETIVSYLEEEGYRCEQAGTVELGSEKVNLYEYDCMLVDIGLPDGSGLSLIKELKKCHPETGIIIISTKNSLDDKISGLDFGADDYLTKPFHLSKLNDALLLLSKIENQQFVERSEIDFCQLIQSRVEYLEELFALKQIEVSVNLEEKVTFAMNPLLAEILINNLLSNALRHNTENGKIIISSENQEITISNTGKATELDASRLFQRFAKPTLSSESNGLGLAIASEICRTNHLQIDYQYSDEMHHLTIKSRKK